MQKKFKDQMYMQILINLRVQKPFLFLVHLAGILDELANPTFLLILSLDCNKTFSVKSSELVEETLVIVGSLINHYSEICLHE